jgi:hypothetical protein
MLAKGETAAKATDSSPFEIKRVLVAVDGSANAERAATAAIETAKSMELNSQFSMWSPNKSPLPLNMRQS